MRHTTVALALLASVAGGLFLSGCRSQPVPLAAQAGSTITLALGGDAEYGGAIGYGSQIYEQSQLYDDQRGYLKFVLLNANPDPGEPAEYAFTTKIVTRVAPDPASIIGLANRVVNTGLPGVDTSRFGISQVVVVLEVPIAPAGTYPLEVRRYFRSDPEPAAAPEVIPYGYPGLPHSFTVLPGTGSPTPEESQTTLVPGNEFPFPTTIAMGDLYPNPKLIVTLDPVPAAAHLVVSYPANRVEILGVLEEQSFGRGSLVLTQDDGAGQLVIDFTDPSGSVKELAVVFRPSAGVDEAIELGEFSIPTRILYDGGGAPIGGQAVATTIR